MEGSNAISGIESLPGATRAVIYLPFEALSSGVVVASAWLPQYCNTEKNGLWLTSNCDSKRKVGHNSFFFLYYNVGPAEATAMLPAAPVSTVLWMESKCSPDCPRQQRNPGDCITAFHCICKGDALPLSFGLSHYVKPVTSPVGWTYFPSHWIPAKSLLFCSNYICNSHLFSTMELTLQMWSKMNKNMPKLICQLPSKMVVGGKGSTFFVSCYQEPN